MPLPTPLHSRTAALCQSFEWRNWAGYLAPGQYESYHEREYFAIRNSAALIDVSPLFKYEITGPDALRLIDRVMTREIARCRAGQVMYSPWCDDDGKVIDDGTISRLGPGHFRLTSADPSLRWFQDCGFGLDAEVVDVSSHLAALALQGPSARVVLQQIVPEADLAGLKYFHLTQTTAGDIPLTITRTGYTGDLGYELWAPADQAPRLWDLLMEAGFPYGLMPAGIVALDIARIEAGLIMSDVDYISSQKALIPSQKSSPYEIGLGWAVKLEKPNFVGRKALLAEKTRGASQWAFIGLEIDWLSLEHAFGKVGLPPQVTGRASRAKVPIYKAGSGSTQVGSVTSSTFSPILKKYIGIGTVEPAYAAPGAELDVEITVENSRETARARVVPTPFYDPEWKRA